ncbi:hypothetical protein [Mollivirus kamchatka]|nr:hypothetical protein [Mollivirus kamchatka]
MVFFLAFLLCSQAATCVALPTRLGTTIQQDTSESDRAPDDAVFECSSTGRGPRDVHWTAKPFYYDPFDLSPSAAPMPCPHLLVTLVDDNDTAMSRFHHSHWHG